MSKRVPVEETQDRILEFIRDYRDKHGYSPTLREIGRELDIHYTTVRIHLLALEKQERISTVPGTYRTVVPID